jgi:hypothetical protein
MNAYYIAKSVSLETIFFKKTKKESKKSVVDKVQKHIDLGYLDSRTKSNPKLMMEMLHFAAKPR